MVSARGRAAKAGASVVSRRAPSALRRAALLLLRRRGPAHARDHDMHERVVARRRRDACSSRASQRGCARRRPRKSAGRDRGLVQFVQQSRGATSASILAEYSDDHVGHGAVFLRCGPRLTRPARKLNMLESCARRRDERQDRGATRDQPEPRHAAAPRSPERLDAATLITPFKKGEVDYDTYARLVEIPDSARARTASWSTAPRRSPRRSRPRSATGSSTSRSRPRRAASPWSRPPARSRCGRRKFSPSMRRQGRRRCAAHRHALLHPAAAARHGATTISK